MRSNRIALLQRRGQHFLPPQMPRSGDRRFFRSDRFGERRAWGEPVGKDLPFRIERCQPRLPMNHEFVGENVRNLGRTVGSVARIGKDRAYKRLHLLALVEVANSIKNSSIYGRGSVIANFPKKCLCRRWL